jgi:hypothetical protein
MTEQTDQLNLRDFAIAVNIIDVCSERGAFKGNELTTVGQLREKFASFVKANTPEQKDETRETPENTEEAE